MQTYGLPCNWKISMPDNWQGEYNAEDGQCIFYPDDSDLTIRITPFHAERDGILAPIEVMESAYLNTIPADAIPRNANICNLDGLSVKMYENELIEDHRAIFVIYIGYYAEGELLSINIFGSDKTGCEQAIDILKTIQRE